MVGLWAQPAEGALLGPRAGDGYLDSSIRTRWAVGVNVPGEGYLCLEMRQGGGSRDVTPTRAARTLIYHPGCLIGYARPAL